MDIDGWTVDGKPFKISLENATGMPAREWHYCYQEWECEEGQIRRMMMWPDGHTEYPEVLWKWSYLKPLLEAQGIFYEDEYSPVRVPVNGHELRVSPTESLDLSYDGLDVCWEK